MTDNPLKPWDREQLEEELRRAQERAEAANRAKDDFLANVSHEIRTPMNAILGMTELTLDSALSDEQRQWLNTVKSAADSLLVIIDELLDFSKVEAGQVALEIAEFSLRAELNDVLRAMTVRAQRKQLTLTCRVAEDVPDRLDGDAARLRQVLSNLIGNAVKFTELGQVEVEVSVLHAGEREGVELCFSVRDTGIGIPREKHAVIFQAFAQQDTSTTRKHGGTGLGLTIAAGLAALMQGTISVHSEPLAGSTFRFRARFGQAALTSALPPTASLIDAEVLLSACGGDAGLLRRVAQALHQHLPAELAHAHACSDRRDTAALRESAHKLCGMIATVSTVAGDVASALEQQSARGDLPEAQRLLVQLQQMTEQILAGLDTLSIETLLELSQGSTRSA